MTELESLFLVLGLVYLALCTVWVRRESYVLRALSGRTMACAPANALVGGETGALQWLNPLPPFGLVYVVHAGGSNNVAGFALDRRGRLHALPGSIQPLSAELVGPGQIALSPDARELVVTEKGTSKIDVFEVSARVHGRAQSVIGSPDGPTPTLVHVAHSAPPQLAGSSGSQPVLGPQRPASRVGCATHDPETGQSKSSRHGSSMSHCRGPPSGPPSREEGK